MDREARRTPPDAVRPVRWGLPDAALVYLAGLVGALLLGGIVAAAVGLEAGDDTPPSVLLAQLVGQDAGLLAALLAVSARKGSGRLAADFGLRVRLRTDLGTVGAGVALQFGLGALLLPLDALAGGEEQAVLDRLQDASGLQFAALALFAVVAAPVLEELLFRGLLLRSLLRRTSAVGAVGASAVAFGAVHVVGDPSVGSFVALPGLVGVGLVAGALAVRDGDLSRPILLHVGFNLVTTVLVLFG